MSDFANLDRIAATDSESLTNELKKACEHMTREVVEGARYGFFEMTVTVETLQSKKRSITIKAEKVVGFFADTKNCRGSVWAMGSL